MWSLNDMKSYVYLIYDPKNSAVKIGKANDILNRLGELQVGNPNKLEIIAEMVCENEQRALQIEDALHSKYKHLYLRGEWFKYDEQIMEDFQSKELRFNGKKTRDSLVIRSIFEDDNTIFNAEMFPRCFFYPDRPAQIKDNYERAYRIPGHSAWRTMEYPTDGKPMLRAIDGRLLSDKINLVFISGKKHEENIKLNNYLKSKNSFSRLPEEFT